jgi:3-deoxy-manno-octulosonate cytidylyltransferase (CMP-KDO synthetase)
MREYLGIIPARYASSRFPGKPLVDILGKPLVIWVCELTVKALGVENTYVATDDDRIFNCVKEHGYNAIMTSSKHLTGTDRLVEVAEKLEAKVYINIQGDEPMVDPDDILRVLEVKKNDPSYIVNAMTNISSVEDPESINIPKVITSLNKELIYMSRKSLPGIKGKFERSPVFKKQVCIYAFNKEELVAYGNQKEKTPLEHFEDIEILRFLELGYKIKMVEVNNASLAVDVIEDVKKVEDALTKRV